MEAYIAIAVVLWAIVLTGWLARSQVKARARPTKKGKGNTQVTACCDAGVVMKMVGKELFVVCAACHTYIGHIVGRDIGSLCFNFPDYVNAAYEHMGTDPAMGLHLTEKELDGLYDIYTSQLLGHYALQATKDAIIKGVT